MSRTTKGKRTRSGASADDRLARLLDSPSLARVVPHLRPETLHQLIRHRGLDACADLLTSATPAQLTSVLDLDLWRPGQPGREEQFDVERFGEWLEALVETGPSAAARTIAALDPAIVVAGLSRYVRVLDPGIFEPTAQSDDEAIDPRDAMREGDSLPIDEGLECEVGGFIVRARRTDAWDAIVTLLLSLDAGHGAYFETVMRGCRRLSNSRPEIDGLDELLQAPEQQMHDVTIAREGRRARQGYATPADARAFLQMARAAKHTHAAENGSPKSHPILAAYFRAIDDDTDPLRDAQRAAAVPPVDAAPPASDAQGERDAARSIEPVLALLADAGMMPDHPRALIEAGDTDLRVSRLAHLRRLMMYVQDRDEAASVARGRELAFLANTLLAGCSVQSRAFTAQEAAEAAASVCNLGLEYWPDRGPDARRDTSLPDSLLVDHDLVTAFEVGWSVLHTEVSLFVADRLMSLLGEIDSVDADIRRGLAILRRTLMREREAGTPWRARGAAEVLGMLDATAWIGVVGLLDECPAIPAAVTAVVEGRTTAVSPTAFAFISTAAQIGDVQLFMRKLRTLLG